MKKTRLHVSSKNIDRFHGDLLVFCLLKSKKGGVKYDASLKQLIQRARELGDFKGKQGEKLIFYPEISGTKHRPAPKRILVIGLGELKKEITRYQLKEMMRIAGGSISEEACRFKAKNVMVVLPTIAGINKRLTSAALTEGLLLGDYRFTKYKKIEDENNAFEGIKDLSIFCAESQSGVRKGMQEGQITAMSGRLARDMANEPANQWTPYSFAKEGQRIARQYGMKCRVLGKGDMKRLGMGGILGVNQGSSLPPKMVIVEYVPPQKKYQTILLVGKGLTFDSGGVSIKPAPGMEDMKYDMCGGAAVLSAMQAVGEVRPSKRVIGIVPATENMVSGSAIKPGDIIHHYNGLSSEVINTDAEGRLILADALAYGVKKYKPDCVVDLATLTGAVIIGLGHHHTGLLSNNDKLAKRLIRAGKESGEPIWRLPLNEDYSEQLKSEVADVKNIGGRPGGTITAAAYLEKFVENTPWAHLDIAGTAWNFTKKSYIPKGPSGVGVRVLIELIRNWKKL